VTIKFCVPLAQKVPEMTFVVLGECEFVLAEDVFIELHVDAKEHVEEVV
jgi:hypothetical protein